MKRFIFFILLCSAGTLTSGWASAGTDPTKPQTNCPILGDKIDKAVYLDYQGKRVYFCCPGCKEKFMEKPDRYIKIMESQGIRLEAALPQTNCPVMGGKINKEVFTDYKGKRIYFCCPGCDETFSKTPEKFISAMEAKGITLDCTLEKEPVHEKEKVPEKTPAPEKEKAEKK
ncbi:MAG: YHS domain-containing protein [Planctomycetota bacterium]